MIRNFLGINLEPDNFIWEHHNDGIFTVSKVYKRGLNEAAGRSTRPWTAILKIVAPTKMKCFTWLVSREACLTLEALQKRGINIASRYLLCKEALETNKWLLEICQS